MNNTFNFSTTSSFFSCKSITVKDLLITFTNAVFNAEYDSINSTSFVSANNFANFDSNFSMIILLFQF